MDSKRLPTRVAFGYPPLTLFLAFQATPYVCPKLEISTYKK